MLEVLEDHVQSSHGRCEINLKTKTTEQEKQLRTILSDRERPRDNKEAVDGQS